MSEAKLVHIDFWDVGQADCSALVFDDHSVLFIDLGLFSTPIVDWLNDRPREIRAILLTHNDSDHAGGLCSLSKDHGRRIQSIYMLQDRPKKHSQMEKVFRCAYEGEQKGYYTINQAAAGQVIWQNQEQGLILKIVHPSFSQAYLASNPNQHSAMAVLTYNDTIIAAWPGDLHLKQVHGELGGAHPWVMTGPHHGAPKDYKDKPEVAQYIADIVPSRAFISVGTSNGYDHPRIRYLLMMAKAGCQVICSQLTQECDRNRSKNGPPVFPGTALLGLRPPRSKSKDSVSCRGSWRVLWAGDHLVSDDHDMEHLTRIAQLRRPRCLQGRGWKKGEAPLAPVS